MEHLPTSSIVLTLVIECLMVALAPNSIESSKLPLPFLQGEFKCYGQVIGRIVLAIMVGYHRIIK